MFLNIRLIIRSLMRFSTMSLLKLICEFGFCKKPTHLERVLVQVVLLMSIVI